MTYILTSSGILSGGNTYGTNTHVRGRYRLSMWKDLQPDTTGNATTDSLNFSWSALDSLVAGASGFNKSYKLLLNLNSADANATVPINTLPQWLIAKGATVWHFANPNHAGADLPLFLPWDTVWQSYALTLIQAICQRYNGQMASIVMGGLGITSELHMPEPSPDGLSTSAAAAAWLASSKIIAAAYASNLTTTTFTAALAIPYSGTDGTNNFNAFVADCDAKYSGRIGYENWGLNAKSTSGYLPNGVIYSHRLTNPVGFQMAGSPTSGGGGSIQGTLRDAMFAGVALGAQYLEVYGQDCDNSLYATDLDDAGAALLPPPGNRLVITTGSYGLTGKSVGLVAARKVMITRGSYALTGKSLGLTTARKLTATQGGYVLTGKSAGIIKSAKLSVAAGLYALTGKNAGLVAGRKLTLTAGNYALTGENLSLIAARKLVATTGSYSLKGETVLLLYTPIGGGYILAVRTGNYALSGQATGLSVARKLTMTQGAYQSTGQSIGLMIGHALTITSGAYALTGKPVGLLANKQLITATGNYALSGQPLTMMVGYRLGITPGSYIVNGQPVALLTARRIVLTAGSYHLAGQGINLIRGLRLVVLSGHYALTGKALDIFVSTALRLFITTGLYRLRINRVAIYKHGRPRADVLLAIADTSQVSVPGTGISSVQGDGSGITKIEPGGTGSIIIKP